MLIDSRHAAPGALYVAIRGEQHDGHKFCAAALADGASGVMVEDDRGLDAPMIVVDDTRLAIGALAREHRARWTGKLVAITGSAGKTTTKELTRAALAAAGTTHAGEGSLNNETGVPLTLLGLRKFHAYGVVEMGMRGKGQIEYLTKLARPDVAVVINAGTAHIELLGSTDAIAEAKAEIWLGLRDGGTLILPADDPRLEQWARTHQPQARHVTFGERGADVALVEYTPREIDGLAGAQLVLEVFGQRRELAFGLVGRHSAIDACAALAAAHAAGASIEAALAGLARARPAAMRGEVLIVAGRNVIVDCYNANPASMTAALRSLAERATKVQALAVVGDMLELGDHAAAAHRQLGMLACELGVGVLALGAQAQTVVAAAGDRGEVADSPATAAARALARTSPGDWILIKASRGMRLERVLIAMQEAP